MNGHVTFEDIKGIKSTLARQLTEFKNKYQEYILFMQVGDFYEIYCEDAVETCRIITDLKLTKRTIEGLDLPMCGVPWHKGEDLANQLAISNKSVVLINQRKDGEEVIRELGRIITPATITSEEYLKRDEHQYMMALYSYKDELGVAILDFLSGEVLTRLVKKYNIFDIVQRYKPKEISLYLTKEWEIELIQKVENLGNVHIYSIPYFYREMQDVIEKHKEQYFADIFVPYSVIAAHYFLMTKINETQNVTVTLKKVDYVEDRDYLYLHSSALINLDILENSQTRKKKGSLFDLLDKTTTSKASRMLKQWIQEPLINSKKIVARQQAVGFFLKEKELREKLQELLTVTSDIERTIARFETDRFKDVELLSFLKTIEVYNVFLKTISQTSNINWMKVTAQNMNKTLTTIIEELKEKITDDKIIKEGYNLRFDRVRNQKLNGRKAMEDYLEEEKEKTGIRNLKLDENKVLGYFFEVTQSNYALVPDYFIERSNLSNKKRYITEKLKEMETEYHEALEQYDYLYKETIKTIIFETRPHFNYIRRVIDFISLNDILMGFAQLAEQYNYKCPIIEQGNNIIIKNAYHPLLQAFSYKKVVPNNCDLPNQSIQIITGPNMGGKSTYLKTVGLIILMAQIGCYVPAELKFTPVDRILVRMGANDYILNDQSTFMLEMEEVSYIVYHATQNSLILMDELGRGTSTNDGLSIAHAVITYIHDKIKAKMICSTHYHELIDLEKELSSVYNYHAEVKQTENGLLFTFKIIRGGMSKSFGIEVAKKAGLPKEIIETSEKLLSSRYV